MHFMQRLIAIDDEFARQRYRFRAFPRSGVRLTGAGRQAEVNGEFGTEKLADYVGTSEVNKPNLVSAINVTNVRSPPPWERSQPISESNLAR